MTGIGLDFFARNTLEVARDLLGKKMEYKGCAGILVETEAYRDDPASHWVRKPRSARLLLDTFGHIYVYFIYGRHYCLNFTTERDGAGAVLIRAVEPTRGLEIMERRRKTRAVAHLTNGPGKVCEAFGIGLELLGKPVGGELKIYPAAEPARIETSRRIGLSRAVELEWRFFIPGNPFVSRGGAGV